jgi:hypothetical protein
LRALEKGTARVFFCRAINHHRENPRRNTTQPPLPLSKGHQEEEKEAELETKEKGKKRERRPAPRTTRKLARPPPERYDGCLLS